MNNTNVEYLGYNIIKEDAYWKLVTCDNKVLAENLSCLEDAQIEACKEEINKLSSTKTSEKQQEDSIPDSNVESSDNKDTNVDDEKPEVNIDAEVIDESCKNERMLEYVNIDNANIITRFMQGKIPLFTYDGPINDSYMHLSDLDSDGNKYYYDTESDSIVIYKD